MRRKEFDQLSSFVEEYELDGDNGARNWSTTYSWCLYTGHLSVYAPCILSYIKFMNSTANCSGTKSTLCFKLSNFI